MNKTATTFGKRGRIAPMRSAVPARAALSPPETTESGLPLSVIAASLMDRPATEASERHSVGGAVPKSWRAGMLAGLVVSFLQAGTIVVGSNADATLAGAASLLGIDAQMAVPLVIAGSLLNSAQTIAFTIFISHRLLRHYALTGLVAYALGGAVAAAVCAAAWLALGLGAPEHGWTIEIASGLAAGFFYRLFAGASAAA